MQVKILHMDGVFMKKRFFLWLLLVAFTALVLGSVETLWTQQSLAEKTVRLHVVANSDSENDQAQKLRIRDAVLTEVSALTASCTDAQEARAVLSAHLSEVEAAASAAMAAEEQPYPVAVSLGIEEFPTRYYDTFTLPAGSYPALRVSIGAAGGHNWWCVVFPSLCTAATSDALKTCAEVGGLEDSETELITGGEEKYTLRFKSFEWLQQLIDWLS